LVSHVETEFLYKAPQTPRGPLVKKTDKKNKKSRDTLTCNGSWCHGGSCTTERRKQHGGEELRLGLHDDALSFLGPRIILLIWRMYQRITLFVLFHVLSHPADTENKTLYASCHISESKYN
jgi:hypothetical protein